MSFNIFTKLKECVEDFDTKSVVLAKGESNNEARYLGNAPSGVLFSQKKIIEKITFCMNSTFEKGAKDSENQTKIYLNGTRFIRDVSRMRTDVDVKNYVFNPDGRDYYWKAYCMSRKFKVWARENNYGETLNLVGDDYTTYGTTVLKQVGKEMQRVPIKNLRNTQDAETLKKAVKSGGYVIEEHNLTLSEMNEMPEWNTEGLEHGKKYKVFEIYTLMPRVLVDGVNQRSPKANDMVQAVAILIPDAQDKNKKDNGKTLFIEQIDEAPYEEAWWERMDGRWLGYGPVEAQLENQRAQNTIFNLQKRALFHSSRHIYQSQSDEVTKNLVAGVRDGTVLHVGPNGQITPVANETRNTAEFNNAMTVLNENSKQKAFAFEVSTGEAMPSNTRVRIGVILDDAVESYWGIKREQLGLFLKRSFFTQLIPIFKKQTKKHNLSLAKGAEGIEYLKQTMIEYHTNERVIDAMLSNAPFSPADIRSAVEAEVNAAPYLYISEIPDGFYDDAIMEMELDITDESTDTQAEIDTLTTIYTQMSAKGDPRAETVLAALLSKTGKSLMAIAGAPQPLPAPNPEQNAAPTY